MTDHSIVDRLASLPNFANIPRHELEWLAERGHLEVSEPGTIIARKGERVERLVIMLCGQMAVRVDRGAGPRRVAEWRVGDISGLLPYSRMSGTPGDTYYDERSEVLAIHEKHFPEMVSACPAFTAHTVHIMLDRARSFNTSDLHDEKMVSLGKLAAGLAHELNNPASASVRSSQMLLESLAQADAASRALAVVGLTDESFRTIDQLRTACLTKLEDPTFTPLEQADRQNDIEDWLLDHRGDTALAAPLADTAVTISALDTLASVISGDALRATLEWIAASCAAHRLAHEIVGASGRIYRLVADVKRFTHMDHLAGPDVVDVETSVRDTIKMLESKARSKRATITVDLEDGLPRVHISGSDLNQALLNVIDNALDALQESGRVAITAHRDLDQVVVRIVDNGGGLSPEVLPKVFDPFFTTKPPGQGTGLGLTITHRILRRYHGDIVLSSQAGNTECRLSLEAEHPSPDPLT